MEPWSTVVSRGGEGSGEGAAGEGREELETHVVSQQRGVSVWRTGVESRPGQGEQEGQPSEQHGGHW